MGKVIVLVIIIAVVVLLYMRSNTNKDAAVKNKLAGSAFLIENKTAEGVIETTSGLQYLVLNKGEGTVHPTWTEGVQLMTVGDKFRFFIPSGLAYGDRSAGQITPGSTLIFDVELLGIN